MGLEQKVRVVIVDDHPLFRQGLRAAIDEDARFEVVGEAARADAALSMILQLRPELAVLDVHLPGMTGFDMVSVLRAKQVPTRTGTDIYIKWQAIRIKMTAMSITTAFQPVRQSMLVADTIMLTRAIRWLLIIMFITSPDVHLFTADNNMRRMQPWKTFIPNNRLLLIF